VFTCVRLTARNLRRMDCAEALGVRYDIVSIVPAADGSMSLSALSSNSGGRLPCVSSSSWRLLPRPSPSSLAGGQFH
jgi:hypothetical protein